MLKNYSQESIVEARRKETIETRRERGTKIYRHVLAARGNVFLSLLPSARVARSVESEIKRLFKCITSPRCRSKKRKKERKKRKKRKKRKRWKGGAGRAREVRTKETNTRGAHRWEEQRDEREGSEEIEGEKMGRGRRKT